MPKHPGSKHSKLDKAEKQLKGKIPGAKVSRRDKKKFTKKQLEAVKRARAQLK